MLMSRELLPGWQDRAFTTIWPLPARLEEDQHGKGNQQE
jgi:hypothetical protein